MLLTHAMACTTTVIQTIQRTRWISWGQSHHYETTALALYLKEQREWDKLTVTPGVRFEVF